MIFNDFLQDPLEVLLTGVLFAKKLEFAGHLFKFVVFVFHGNQLMQGLKLIESFIGSDDQLAVDVDFNDVFLGYRDMILYA